MRRADVTDLRATLEALEETLWRAETRFDRVLMDATFAPDFEEFGRSGRRYSREDMLFDAANSVPIPALLPLRDFCVRSLTTDMALVTYISEVRYPNGVEWANRSSLWHRSPAGSQLRFHQGTPIQSPAP